MQFPPTKIQVLTIPGDITYRLLHDFLEFRHQAADLLDCVVICDCSKMKLIDPMGLCLLKHWLDELNAQGVEIHLENIRYSMECYLRRMDLFKNCPFLHFPDHTSNNVRSEMPGKVIELLALNTPEHVNEVANKLASVIASGMPGISAEPDPEGMRPSSGEQMEQTLEYVFSEILMNALDHGRRRNYQHAVANIAAQYYPTLQVLVVSILDNGCGLLETLQSHPLMADEHTDSKAITIALLPRVSCNRDWELGLDSGNQGIGLTVSSRIALAAGGGCGIFSGSSWHVLKTNADVEVKEIPYWRGTGVNFVFRKADLLHVNRAEIIRELPDWKLVNEIRFV